MPGEEKAYAHVQAPEAALKSQSEGKSGPREGCAPEHFVKREKEVGASAVSMIPGSPQDPLLTAQA